MTRIRSITLITALAAVFYFSPAKASETEPELPPDSIYSSNTVKESSLPISKTEELIEEKVIVTKVLNDGTVITETGDMELLAKRNKTTRENDKNLTYQPTGLRKFMLGAELGMGLDLSSTDMSTFNFDIVFGYRYKIIQLIGVKLGIHKSLGTSDSFMPISFVFRTSFTPRPSLFFFHMNAGYSFNTVSSSPMFGDITAQVGCGLNLVQRRRFQSYLILGVGFRHFNHRHREMIQIEKDNVGFAQVTLGISI